MFILTPTGSLNYEATGRFIDHLQSNIKERIKLVISLDSLTDASSLDHSLNVIPGAMAEKDSVADSFKKQLQKSAKKKNVKTEIKDASFGAPEHKKYVQFEHVIYEEKGIPALTVTAKDTIYSNRYQKYSVFDKSLNSDNLKRNILILTDTIAHLIYTFADKNHVLISDADEKTIIDDKYYQDIKTFLQGTARAPFLVTRDSAPSKEIQRLMSTSVKNVKRMGVTIKDVQFYEEKY